MHRFPEAGAGRRVAEGAVRVLLGTHALSGRSSGARAVEVAHGVIEDGSNEEFW